MALRKVVGTALASLAIVGSGLTGSASAASAAPSPVAAECGFWESGGNAYYGHCGNTTVQIRVDYWNNTSDYECVGPHRNKYLGSSFHVDYAVYQRLC